MIQFFRNGLASIHFSSIGLVSVGLVSVGCTAKLQYLSIEKDFTPQQLNSGYLLVVDPVMDDTFSNTGLNASPNSIRQGDPNISSLSVSEAQILGKLLLDEIKDENEKLKVNSIAAIKKLKSGEIDILRQTLAKSKDAPQEFLNQHSETFMSFPNPHRFLAVLRIESESKSQDNSTREESQKNSKGVIEKYTVEEWKSIRKMTASMQVYDLKLKKQVYSGIQTREAANRREEKLKDSGNAFIVIGSQSKDRYPPFPERQDVFKILADDFADNLPNEDD